MRIPITAEARHGVSVMFERARGLRIDLHTEERARLQAEVAAFKAAGGKVTVLPYLWKAAPPASGQQAIRDVRFQRIRGRDEDHDAISLPRPHVRPGAGREGTGAARGGQATEHSADLEERPPPFIGGPSAGPTPGVRDVVALIRCARCTGAPQIEVTRSRRFRRERPRTARGSGKGSARVRP